jgi:hypothetical protein
MITRWLRMLAYTGLLGCLCVGCKVYDDALLAGGAGGNGGNDAGRSGMAGDAPEPCAASEEVCNDVDDDCNGVVDDEAQASADCSQRYHARVECGRGGFCLFVPSNPMCDPGWHHCDGMPQTGCESPTPCVCTTCDDAGADDGGVAE